MTPPARPSSSICLLRETDGGCEVLMAQRGAGARFMGGAWVFPGGVVDRSDGGAEAQAAMDGCQGAPDVAWRAAALRELVEEAGVWLSAEPFTLSPAERPHGTAVYAAAAADDGVPFRGGDLAYFSNWITPTMVPVRFDARFYVAVVNGDVVGVADGVEMDDVAWVAPTDALDRFAAGLFVLPLPTRKTLEHFAGLGSAAAIVRYARELDVVPPIQPRIRTTNDGRIEAVLPGEPGFEDLEDLPPDPDAFGRAVRVATIDGQPIPELGG